MQKRGKVRSGTATTAERRTVTTANRNSEMGQVIPAYLLGSGTEWHNRICCYHIAFKVFWLARDLMNPWLAWW